MAREPFVDGPRFEIHVSEDRSRIDVNDKKDRKVFTLLDADDLSELLDHLRETVHFVREWRP